MKTRILLLAAFLAHGIVSAAPVTNWAILNGTVIENCADIFERDGNVYSAVLERHSVPSNFYGCAVVGWCYGSGLKTVPINWVNGLYKDDMTKGETYTLVSDEKDYVLAPVVESIPYSLSYNVNGGSGKVDRLFDIKTIDTPIALAKSGFSKVGCVLAGWANTADADKPEFALGQTVTGKTLGLKIYKKDYTHILYAVWGQPPAVTLEYNLDGGKVGERAPTTAPYDEAVEISAPTKTGHMFAGWTVKGSLGTEARWGADVECASSLHSGNTIANGSSGAVYLKQLCDSADPVTITLTAQWTVNATTLEYDLQGGTAGASSPKTLTWDEVARISAPTRAGYVFTGWKVNGKIALDKTAAWGTSANPANALRIGDTVANGSRGDVYLKNLIAGNGAAVTLVAQWSKVEFTIVYNLDGGAFASGANVPTTAFTETAVTVPDPEKPNCSFLGWNIKEDSRSPSSGCTFNSLTPNEDGFVELTAVWEPVAYSVSYDCAGGRFDAAQPSSAKCGTAFAVAAPTREGYVFAGWKVTAHLDATIAKWGVSPNPTESFASSDDVAFNGVAGTVWFVDLTAADVEVKLEAKWRPRTCRVEYHLAGGTGGEALPTTFTFGDATVVPTVPSQTGKTFLGWKAPDGKVYRDTDRDKLVALSGSFSGGALRLEAVWTNATSKVTFDAGGAINNTQSSVYVTYGSAAPDIAPVPHYNASCRFAGYFTERNGRGEMLWDDEGRATNANGNAIWAITSNITVHAYKVGYTYRLSFDTGAGTKVAPVTGTAFVPVTLPDATATTREGYHLAGWARTAGGTAAYEPGAAFDARDEQITADNAPLKLYAVWAEDTPKTYTIKYYANGGILRNVPTPTEDQYVLTNDITEVATKTVPAGSTVDYLLRISPNDGFLYYGNTTWSFGGFSQHELVREGYIWKGWSLDPCETIAVGSDTTIKSTISRMEQIAKDLYGVTFEDGETIKLFAIWERNEVPDPIQIDATAANVVKTYDGVPTNITVSVAPISANDCTIYYSIDSADGKTGSWSTTNILVNALAETNVMFTIWYSVVPDVAGYIGVTNTATVTITPQTHPLPELPELSTVLGWGISVSTNESVGAWYVGPDAKTLSTITNDDTEVAFTLAGTIPNEPGTLAFRYKVTVPTGEDALGFDFAFESNGVDVAGAGLQYEEYGNLPENWLYVTNHFAGGEGVKWRLANESGVPSSVPVTLLIDSVTWTPDGGDPTTGTGDEVVTIIQGGVTNHAVVISGEVDPDDPRQRQIELPQSVTSVGVTFRRNDGTAAPRDVVACGTYLPGAKFGTLPEGPEAGDTEYDFAGWYADAACETNVTESSTVPNRPDVTLYAGWKWARRVVTFVDPLERTIPAGGVYQAGLTLGDTTHYWPEPECEGYDFEGWFSAEESGVEVAGATVVTTNLPRTLFAHWSVKSDEERADALKCLVLDDGGETNVWAAIDIDTLDLDVANARLNSLEPYREGKDFLGWFDAPEGGAQVTSVAGFLDKAARSVYAQFGDAPAEDTFVTVVFSSDGATWAEVVARVGAPYAESVLWPGDPAKGGYDFAGWKSSTGVMLTSDTIVAKDVTRAIAQWTSSAAPVPTPVPESVVPEYELTFLLNDGSDAEYARVYVLSNESAGVKWPAGEPERPEDATTNAVFAGWFDAAAGGEEWTAESAVVADMLLYAQWKEQENPPPPPPPPVPKFNVVFLMNDGTAGKFCEKTCESNACVSVVWPTSEPVRTGYEFLGWDVPQTTVVAADLTIRAQWKEIPPPPPPPHFTATKAMTYYGWLQDPSTGEITALLTVKTGKKATRTGLSKTTISVTPVGGKKKSYKDTIPTGYDITDMYGIVYDDAYLAGAFNGAEVVAYADPTKDASKKAALAACAGTWSFAAADGAGYATFSVTVSSKGKAKLTGTLANGTKVSLSAQGVLGQGMFVVPLVYAKRTAQFAFVFQKDDDGALRVDGCAGAAADWQFTVPSANRALAAGNWVFRAELPTSRDYIEALDGYDVTPDGEVFAVAAKWTFDKVKGKLKVDRDVGLTVIPSRDVVQNLSSLKLTYTARTGAVKGSFKLHYLDSSGRLKKDSATVVGMVIDGKLYATATVKKVASFPVWVERAQ